jgi:hypothetical protein
VVLGLRLGPIPLTRLLYPKCCVGSLDGVSKAIQREGRPRGRWAGSDSAALARLQDRIGSQSCRGVHRQALRFRCGRGARRDGGGSSWRRDALQIGGCGEITSAWHAARARCISSRYEVLCSTLSLRRDTIADMWRIQKVVNPDA